MSYADGLLSTGERITRRTKQHPFVFLWGARYAIVAIVLAIVVVILGSGLSQDGFSGTLKSVLNIAVLVLFIGGLAVALWTVLRYLNQEYVLTNRRVIQVEGVFNRNSTDSSLEKINDAVLSQSIFGRMFDFGDLSVLTASESGIDKMKMLRSPIEFKKAMLDAKHEFEVDMERAGWAPSPPIREGSPVGPGASVGQSAAAPPQTAPRMAPPAPPAAPAAPAPVAPPPPAPRADPDEVTRTLSNLADLRDRGAITAEDYEAKKSDLLGRL